MLADPQARQTARHILSEDYQLEYGTARLELHPDDVPAGARVLVIDDVLATGGTAAAACRLLRRAGAEIAGVAVAIELGELPGGPPCRGSRSPPCADGERGSALAAEATARASERRGQA